MILIVAYIVLIIILKIKFDLSENKMDDENAESTKKDYKLNIKD
ncbi:MAG: hypothetical protein AAF519_12265 [Bacteroidota bacterium]